MERKPDYKGATHFVEQWRSKHDKDNSFTFSGEIGIDKIDKSLNDTKNTKTLKTVAVFLIKPKP